MKCNKIFSVIILQLLFIQIHTQTVDKVIIKAEDYRTQQEGRYQEWACDVHAYLYKNNQFIPNDSLFYYEWYHNKEDSYVLVKSGYGLDSVYSDGHYGQKWNYFVRVTGDNFSIMSDTLFNVGKDEINYPIEVTLLAKNEQGKNIEILVWEYTNPRWFRKHHTGINIKASFLIMKRKRYGQILK
ncbi:hypothetical protein ACX8XN_08965 [Calditrichota bacterium GD2]